MSTFLVYAGTIVIIIWGIAHIVPVRSVVGGFGTIPDDSRKIITMEWIAGGLTLLFIGVPAALVASAMGAGDPVLRTVILASAGMLLVLAALTALTGARTASVPLKLCPFVTAFAALLFIAGVLL